MPVTLPPAPPATATPYDLSIYIGTVVQAYLDDAKLWRVWSGGTPTGGTGANGAGVGGYYPVPDGQGGLVYAPSPQTMIAFGAQFTQQALVALGDLNDRIADFEGEIGDLQAAMDAAYSAQQSALAATAAALDARIARAMLFPSDFGLGTEYWVEGNGQIAAPSTASNNPLSGSFPLVGGIGVVYQTEASPQTCNSFGPVGYVAGLPGTHIRITAKVRCVRDDTSGAPAVKTGVSILPLNGDFSLVSYVSGQAITALKVADGWQTVTYEIIVPSDAPAAFYRPTAFYNVNGNTPNPLQPDNSVQGNGQYQFQFVSISAKKPGDLFAPAISTLTGSGTYTTPPGTDYLVVDIEGGQGGSHGQGSGSGRGGSGSASTFAGTSAAGGSPGQRGQRTRFVISNPAATYSFSQGSGGAGGGGGSFSNTTFDSTGKGTTTSTGGDGGDAGAAGTVIVEAH